jgi:hypothetical protein
MEEDPGDDDAWEEEEPDLDNLPQRRPVGRIGKDVPRDDEFGNPFVTIVDVSGIHHLPLLTCSCQGGGRDVQDCLFSGLFPASFRIIRTLFTLSVLDDCRLANLECKTTTYQYYQKLRRTTNPAFPSSVPDRYTELRRLSRQWRILNKLKIHGFGYNDALPGIGDLATFCPTCPQPGINLADDWKTKCGRYLFT